MINKRIKQIQINNLYGKQQLYKKKNLTEKQKFLNSIYKKNHVLIK